MRFPRFVPVVVWITLNMVSLFAQSPNGNINGLVSDPSSASVIGAEVVAVNDVTGIQYTTRTNGEGIYVLPNLRLLTVARDRCQGKGTTKLHGIPLLEWVLRYGRDLTN
jgi:hypothetical protein